MEYTLQPIADTTFELKEYTPASISETTWDLGVPGSRVLLLSPANLATGVSKTPTFSWEAFEPASDRRYQVLVSTLENDFSNALQYVTPNTTFTIPESDQLAGTTTYYWKIVPATAIVLSDYSETFDVADQSGWTQDWTTQTISGTGTQTISSNRATLSIDAGGISVAELDGITFENLDLYLRSQTFSDVDAEPTYHFRTQGTWRDDNFITGYFLYLVGTQVITGRIPEGGGVQLLSGGSASFTRTSGTNYDIRIRADGFRIRIYIWESSASEPSEPLIDVVDTNETFSSGGFAVKLAGSIASNIAIDSVEATFAEATAGVTVTSFAIDQADSELSANSTGQLTTTTQGTNVSGGATFASSDTNVVTVNNDGTYTWVGQGTATITATSTDDNSFTDTVVITALADTGFVSQDSQEGDELFLNELYAATQGQHLEILASVNDLPTRAEGAFDLDQYLVNGDLYFYDADSRTDDWVNMGPVWFDETGWNSGDVDLSIHNPVGVTKAQINGEWRVTKIDMQKIKSEGTFEGKTLWDGNVLAGTLPPSWGNLTKCKEINLKQNFFIGDIPDTLQPTSELEYIKLGGNEGELVDSRAFSNNNDYQGIKNGKEYEERNKFEGNLPASIGGLSAIYWVEIRRQYMTGNLPPEWGNATTLKHIYLNNQKGIFQGTLPDEWGNLNPDKIDLIGKSSARDPYADWTHRLQGPVPDSWNTNWSFMSSVRLDRNELNGVVPDFPNAFDKRHWTVADNNFVSPDGPYLFGPGLFDNGGNRRLALIAFGGNQLTGGFRENVQSAREDQPFEYFNLFTFQVSGLGITGPLPNWLNSVPELSQFNPSSNSFDAVFPTTIANGSNVKIFNLNSFCDLSSGGIGDLPDVEWKSQHQQINFGNTGATGTIPASWQSMQTNEVNGIWELNWSNNELEGLVPAWLADLRDITRLYLNNNRFTYKDILPHYDEILTTVQGNSKFASPRLYVGPQKPFNVPAESVSGAGSATVDLSSIDYTNNSYQWQRLDNGSWVNVSGQTTHTLTTSTSGDYRLRITNPGAPDIDSDFRGLTESLSKTITVTIT